MPDSWYLPTLISALGLGFYDICKKHAVKENAVMPTLFLATLCGTLFFAGAVYFQSGTGKLLQLTANGHLLTFLKALLVAASWICVYYAMRKLPISLASPIRSTSPLWTMAGGILIYHEIPTAFQALGMGIILIGYIMFSFFGSKEGFPWKNPSMLLIIGGTLLGAGSALYDKYLLGVRKLDPEMLQFYFSLYLVVILGAAWGIRTIFGHKHHFSWRWSIPLTGILLVAADFCYFHAISSADAPISIISLLRRCSCVVTFFLGAKIFHDVNVKRKALALLLLVIGAALLALAK